MRNLMISLFLFCSFSSLAADTLNVMHYNLLYYGVNNGTCNQTSNSYQVKNQNLRVVLNYFTPDILTLNEISPNTTYHQSLLTNVLNTDGRYYYKLAQTSNIAGSDIINLVAYNSFKLEIAARYSLVTSVRDINIYKMYYKYDDLAFTGDSVFLYVVVAHLKAGSSSSDKTERAAQTQILMEFLQNNQIDGNLIFSGDFNLTGSSEQAYQNLLSWPQPAYRFVDPVDAPGNWSNNAAFSAYHTQSSRNEPYGCGATGGLDDRFDFTLASLEVMNGSRQITYVPSSYRAIGQDGLHYNQSVNVLPNNSAPVDVLNALYEISDHLPVIMKLKVDVDEYQYSPGLIISEYIEGSNNNKALELFNPTPSTVNLALYQLARYGNGSLTADTVSLAGMLPPYQTYVVVLDKRNPQGTGLETPVDSLLQAKADTFLCPVYDINKTMYFNGDDAMAIVRKSDGALIDLIGKIGEDPELGWTTDSLCSAPYTTACGADPWTKEHTLVRRYEIDKGVLSNPEYFVVNREWELFPADDFSQLGFHDNISHPDVPPGFSFIQTSSSHIIGITLGTNPAISGIPIQPGDFIGVFYKDGPEEKCAGSVVWNGNQNLAIVAFGDEQITVQKDGFSVNENLIWKIYSRSSGQSFYAKAVYDSLRPVYNGKFTPFGLSALKSLRADETINFTLNLPAGWSGISSYLFPADPKMETVFQAVTSNLVLVQHPDGVYWPSQNTNTLGNWDNRKGYLLKMNASVSLTLTGITDPDPEFLFQAGWNYFPVMRSCGIIATELGAALEGNLELILEMAGNNVYWPALNINTIGTLEPGKAYFVKSTANKRVVFTECTR